MLRLENVAASYGPVQVLHGVSLEAAPGEVLCLLGRNGAGKTTTLKATMGLVERTAGQVLLGDQPIHDLLPEQIPRLGVGYVPQGRRLFAELSVAENLEIGLMARGSDASVREKALGLFPVLRDRLRQRAGTLSGGEQQMLAIARALCLDPQVLLLDEPTEGLQPSMVALIRDVIADLAGQGVTIILVEQRIDAVRTIADRVVFIENGESALTMQAADLDGREDLLHRYLGVGHAAQ